MCLCLKGFLNTAWRCSGRRQFCQNSLSEWNSQYLIIHKTQLHQTCIYFGIWQNRTKFRLHPMCQSLSLAVPKETLKGPGHFICFLSWCSLLLSHLLSLEWHKYSGYLSPWKKSLYWVENLVCYYWEIWFICFKQPSGISLFILYVMHIFKLQDPNP